jgi:Bax protein
MNIKLIVKRLWCLTMFLSVGYFIFYLGGYYPNSNIQDKIKKKAIEEIRRIDSLQEPKINTATNQKFIDSMKKCIAFHNLEIRKEEQIPTALIIAQAIVESDYGNSRFATLGHNLFGIRVWSKNGILPLKQDPSINWRVKTYKTKCQSVKDYMNTLNNNHHYSEFRNLRKRTKDPIKLAETLENYSTSQTYRTEIVRMINKIKHKI